MIRKYFPQGFSDSATNFFKIIIQCCPLIMLFLGSKGMDHVMVDLVIKRKFYKDIIVK